MEFHKPKPIHNWREFLTEIGVVVIGVCIALAAEQTVEWLHWRAQVAEAREIVAAELARDLEGAIIRVRAQPCLERRFDELARILDAAAKTGSLPPVGDIGLPPRNLFMNGQWETVVASETATHFPRQQLADISSTYKQFERIGDVYNWEEQNWQDLYAIVGPGRRLDPASEAELRKALSNVRGNSRVIMNLSAIAIGNVKSLDLAFSPDERAQIAHDTHVPLAGPGTQNGRNSTISICGPIGAVPASYGQAQFSNLPAAIGGMVKAIPDFSNGAR